MQDLLLILILLLVLLTLISLLGGSIYQDQSYLAEIERYFHDYLKGFIGQGPGSSAPSSAGGNSGTSAGGALASSSPMAAAPAGDGPVPSEAHLIGNATASAASSAAPVPSSSGQEGQNSNLLASAPTTAAGSSCCKNCGNVTCSGCTKAPGSGRVWWTAESIDDTDAAAGGATSIGYASASTGGAKQRREKGAYAKF
jgi:hypothetical protein